MKLPKVLYVRIATEGNESYVVAYPNLADCVEDGEVNLVGTYWLKGKPTKYEKVVSARD